MKCRCPSDTHGHKPGKCQALAVTPDHMCQPCHDKMEKEVESAASLGENGRSLSHELADIAKLPELLVKRIAPSRFSGTPPFSLTSASRSPRARGTSPVPRGNLGDPRWEGDPI